MIRPRTQRPSSTNDRHIPQSKPPRNDTRCGHKPNHNPNQTSRKVRVKPHRDGDVADESLHYGPGTIAKHPENYYERGRWKRGRGQRTRVRGRRGSKRTETGTRAMKACITDSSEAPRVLLRKGEVEERQRGKGRTTRGGDAWELGWMMIP
ncbi:hypothetical protein M405DRAFT_847793 [Rhizopogon salebrosus TDB-379]|nr:hypothetical protein M405DRAFT_847793 [Rhizopogon salebrosus TDB-379]